MIDAQEFDSYVSRLALEHSRLRKLDSISVENLDRIASGPQELEQDWIGAVGQLLEFVVSGPGVIVRYSATELPDSALTIPSKRS